MKELHWDMVGCNGDMVGCNGESVGEEFLENFNFFFSKVERMSDLNFFFFNK